MSLRLKIYGTGDLNHINKRQDRCTNLDRND